MTPSLTGPEVFATLAGYVVVYTFIFTFGAVYIYALLREGPGQTDDTRALFVGQRDICSATPATTPLKAGYRVGTMTPTPLPPREPLTGPTWRSSS